METLSTSKIFGGMSHTVRHESGACGCPMQLAVFVPPQAGDGPVPAVYWLSGLTCTEENFTVKAGAQRYAAELGLMLVAPDTSPRGLDLPGEDDSWDFGSGAGFYLDATRPPWADNYRMYDYVTRELPAFIEKNFPSDPARKSISGHSMGGHGALTIALKNPGTYRSVSAFAPIAAPMQCPWGVKAFSHYLGDDRRSWEPYDATCLIEKGGNPIGLLVDQGDADSFLEEQLRPDLLQAACERASHPLTLRMQPGYDHSYNFIATFIGDHLRYHAAALENR